MNVLRFHAPNAKSIVLEKLPMRAMSVHADAVVSTLEGSRDLIKTLDRFPRFRQRENRCQAVSCDEQFALGDWETKQRRLDINVKHQSDR